MQNKSPGPSANYPRATLVSAHAPRPSTQGHNGANGQLRVKSWGGYPSRCVSVHARVCECVGHIYVHTCFLYLLACLVLSHTLQGYTKRNTCPWMGRWCGVCNKKVPKTRGGGWGSHQGSSHHVTYTRLHHLGAPRAPPFVQWEISQHYR